MFNTPDSYTNRNVADANMKYRERVFCKAFVIAFRDEADRRLAD